MGHMEMYCVAVRNILGPICFSHAQLRVANMKHVVVFFLPTLLEACFIFQSASPSPRNSSSHCILLLLRVCLGGTLTDSDGSLGKMQLGIP